MQSPKPADFLLLLEVFRRGLILDLVSKNDVTSWADEIILNTDEPGYLFIEVSLCTTTNNLIEVIGAYVDENESLIGTRVLMGLLYKKLTDGNNLLNVDDALRMLWNLDWRITLTDFELSFIYSFDDYAFADSKELEEDVIDFLSIYAQFAFTNYNNWAEINERIEVSLKQKQAEFKIKTEAIRQEWQVKNESLKQAELEALIKANRKRRSKRNFNICILISVVVAMLLCAYLAPATELYLSAIIGPVFIYVLIIGKEHMLRERRKIR
ncbi:hypothetical protein [Mucilaginibacter agri]|uniref:Uncharacterized protein n=1 Tax=Mucilaginibacter agri TaxID=2695265 RepID=A0A965ZGR0_9SPHI|nr:hypothetical protein [Mucilaginibacter agri]NCD69366.1 hypothetical protein [Mucilaginibacter agri]